MTTSAAAGGPQAADDTRISSDDDGPSRKRMRVSRACDACRRRKERCNGAQPSCQRCKAISRPCSYNPYRKRGLRTGYVKGTEILLGLLLHSYDGAEGLILSVLQNRTASQTLRGAGSTAAPTATSLLDAWRKSAALEHLQRTLAVSEPDEDDESYLQNLDDKLTSAFNGLPRRDADVRDESPPATIAYEDHHLPDPISPTAGLRGPSPRIVRHEALATDVSPTLPPTWPLLIDIYSSHVHTWLPIVHKHSLLRTASLLHEHVSGGTTGHGELPGSGEIASLWATLALASYHLETFELSSGTSPGGSFRDQFSSAQLQTVARSLAVQDQSCRDAGQVHAFLVMALLEILQGSWVEAWLWIGRAVYVATSLGVVPSHEHGGRQGVDGVSKRLFLGCFILDTLVSIRVGYRPYLNKTDLQALGDITVDGLEEWEPWSPVLGSPSGASAASSPTAPGRVLSVFSHLGYLSGLLNSLHRTPLDSEPGPVPQELLRELIHRLESMPTTNGPAAPHGPQPAQAIEPPHFINLRIAAATAYVMIKSREADSPTASVLGQQTDYNLPAALLDTLEFLKSTPARSPVFTPGWLPSTSFIFFQLLEQCEASAPDAHLRADWPGPKQHPSHHGTSYLGDASSMLAMPTAPTGDDHQLLMSLISLNNSQPRIPQGLVHEANALFTADSIPEPGHGEMRQSSFQSPERSQIRNPLSTDPLQRRSSLMPSIASSEPSQHPAVQPGEQDATAIAAQAGTTEPPAAVTSPSDTADPDGLFNQLALLDTADWHAGSADFMEHLGLLRDGSFVDLNTLFS